MSCSCCDKKLNSGMIHRFDKLTGDEYKSCPHCSDANGSEHVFHPYPASFGSSPARKTPTNPEGDQSYCIDCRQLDKCVVSQTYRNGRVCSSLVPEFNEAFSE